MKILIADDSPVVRDALRDLLAEIPGAQVLTADNAAAAIDILAALQPEAAILDLRVPGGGLALIAVLEAATRDSPGTLLIVLTHRTDAAAREACLEAGAHHFLDKFADFDIAVRLVRERCEEKVPGTFSREVA